MSESALNLRPATALLEPVKQWLLRLSIFWLYIPVRRWAHRCRDSIRKLKTVFGLRPCLVPARNSFRSAFWREFGRARGTRLRALRKVDGNVSLAELAILNALCRTHRPKAILEIGTFDGRTTLNLALNSEATVLTLDLPANEATVFAITRGNQACIRKAATGTRFYTPAPDPRITRLYGDSASFDFSPWHRRIDFVFVDGAHDYDYVINDSLVALRLLRPDGGIIVWHDYGSWPDVTRALHDLADQMPGLPLVRILDTSLVVCLQKKPVAVPGNGKASLASAGPVRPVCEESPRPIEICRPVGAPILPS